MNIFESLVLGVVQGFTEFIPVSSSAHLEIFPKIFGWENPSTAYDTFLHIGTLLALLVFYRARIYKYTKSLFKIFDRSGLKNIDKQNIRVIRNILISSIPAGIFGFVLQDLISDFYDSPSNDSLSNFFILVAMFLVGVAFLVIPKILRNKKFSIESLSARGSLFIGLAQIFAFFRGVSRSGITILAGQFAGLKRVDAAEFAFLMSIPIMFATSVYSVLKLFSGSPELIQRDLLASMVGLVSSFVAGSFAIKFLISYLKNNSLAIFGYYRIAFAILIFVLLVA